METFTYIHRGHPRRLGEFSSVGATSGSRDAGALPSGVVSQDPTPPRFFPLPSLFPVTLSVPSLFPSFSRTSSLDSPRSLLLIVPGVFFWFGGGMFLGLPEAKRGRCLFLDGGEFSFSLAFLGRGISVVSSFV